MVSKTRSNCSSVLSMMRLSARTPAPWTSAVTGPHSRRTSSRAARDRVGVLHVDREVARRRPGRRERVERGADLALREHARDARGDLRGLELAPLCVRLRRHRALERELVGAAELVGLRRERGAPEQHDARAAGARERDEPGRRHAAPAAGSDHHRAGADARPRVWRDARLDQRERRAPPVGVEPHLGRHTAGAQLLDDRVGHGLGGARAALAVDGPHRGVRPLERGRARERGEAARPGPQAGAPARARSRRPCPARSRTGRPRPRSALPRRAPRGMPRGRRRSRRRCCRPRAGRRGRSRRRRRAAPRRRRAPSPRAGRALRRRAPRARHRLR